MFAPHDGTLTAAHCAALTGPLDVRVPFDLAAFVRSVADHLGCAITLVATRFPDSPRCGAIVAEHGGHRIYYPEPAISATPQQYHHAEHTAVVHELGHLLLGHEGGATGHRRRARAAAASLQQIMPTLSIASIRDALALGELDALADETSAIRAERSADIFTAYVLAAPSPSAGAPLARDSVPRQRDVQRPQYIS